MIVNEDYCCCIFGDRFAKNFARMYERGVEKASRYGNVALEPVLRVENGDMKLFYGQILKPVTEDLVNVSRTANGHAILAVLGCHPAPELEGGMNCDGSRVANSGERGESGNRLRRQSPQRPMRAAENCVTNLSGRMAFGATAEEDCEQLCGAESARTLGFEAFAGTFCVRELAEDTYCHQCIP
jgi:hypothetical protein